MVTVQARVVTEEENVSAKPALAVQLRINMHACDNNPHGTMKRVWDNYQHIGEVMKTPKKKIVVAATCRDGVKYIYMREWYLARDTNEWTPNNKRSLSIPVTYPTLDENNRVSNILTPLADVLNMAYEAVEALEDMWLFDDEHAVFVEKKKKGQNNNGNTSED